MNFDMKEQAGLNDIPNHRVITLENGNKLNLIRKDPYGFIYLSLDRGALPTGLAGSAYTDWTSARAAADSYVRDRQSVVAELTDKEPKKK